MEPRHGFRSVQRADQLGLFDTLLPGDADLVRFAITWHSRPDGRAVAASAKSPKLHAPAERERALRILWLLKDADALDRVRLSRW
jgi:hypothetical protein